MEKSVPELGNIPPTSLRGMTSIPLLISGCGVLVSKYESTEAIL